MIIETLLAVTGLAALVTFLVPDEYAGRAAAVFSVLPLLGSLLLWARFNGAGNALVDGDVAFD